MPKAPKDALNELHGAVAEIILERLRNPEGCSAADVKNAMQFLKDNGIQADSGNLTPTEQSILDEIPEFDPAEVPHLAPQ